MACVCMSAGGTRAVFYMGALREMQDTYRHVIDGYDTTWAGASAGSIVATLMACRVPVDEGCTAMQRGKMLPGGKLSAARRLLGVMMCGRQFMYSGRTLERQICNLLTGRCIQAPVNIAVENSLSKQLEIRCKPGSSTQDLVQAAMASASIPGVFKPRYIPHVGECTDGGVHCPFPMETLRRFAHNGGDMLVIMHSHPWIRPAQGGETGNPILRGMEFIQSMAQEHMLEHLNEVFDTVPYQDGVFECMYERRNGQLVRHGAGNVRVVFVAPRYKQFNANGGGFASLNFLGNKSSLQKIMDEGRYAGRRVCKLSSPIVL